MKFWPFPMIRNFDTSDDLSLLFEDFAQAEDLEIVKQDQFWTVISCRLGQIPESRV